MKKDLKEALNNNFANMDLRGWSFKGQNLSGANFSNADLEGACFIDAILVSTNFEGANLKNTDFSCAMHGVQTLMRRTAKILYFYLQT